MTATTLNADTPNSQRSALTKLVLCSLLGLMFFLMPIHYDGKWTILMGIAADFINSAIGENMPLFTLPMFIVSAAISLCYYLLPSHIAKRLPYAKYLIASHWAWVALSSVGGLVSLMLLAGVGPDWIVGKDTGVTAYIDVAGAIYLIIGLGCLFLPFLTDYGLLDFVGTMMRPYFRRLFNLPGRSTVDTLASWVGSSSIAVLMTSYQYERGYYTAKESAVLATSFSVVSLPFVLLTSQVAGLPEYFFQLYGSMALICIICAIIIPKLPPLNRIPDEYYPPVGKQLFEEAEGSHSSFSWACKKSYDVARHSASPTVALKKGFGSMLDIFIMMMPAAMTIEFLALVLYYHTPIFQTLTYPLVHILNWMQVPEATAAAPGLVIGLLDQFVPAIIAGERESLLTRFVLAGLSVTQLIFFAETALLIMRSKIPLSVINLIAIFCIRTVIALPILVVIAHWLF
ncbi:YjiH family protein [Aestuariicella hydrocarbonica]|uniref:YjiH family protein n=1 Tax=Pseudomaricurvus hydrocarbonicus TaxID=1470433 RepID=A0A9E5MMA4_9GAMM|nr:YjiH family protein [Aestuariicella hydrocarbonica]NHO65840.1 YjiH family protein [Aestuariicella hydrocarbonica]